MKKNSKFGKKSGAAPGHKKQHAKAQERGRAKNPKASNGSRRDSDTAGGRQRRASLYGFHAVAEAWLNESRVMNALYVTEQGLKSFENVLDDAKAQGLTRPSPTIIDKAALEKSLPQGAVHQGLAIDCPLIDESSVQDFIISAADKPSRLVMLDQVTDPHNVGAILRSACGFGFDGMIMQRKHAPELNGVLAKTACGAVEHVPVAYETNLSRSLETLKEAGYFVYGLDERGENVQSLKSIPDKVVIVLGAEGPGLRRLVKDNCDTLVRLPMHGPMPSINVSNAAAVAFYAFSHEGD